jgi:citrate synthase
MASTTRAAASGLEGVEIAETALSDVDGARGRLIIAGHDVEGLAGRVTFEQALGLVLGGRLPDETETARLRERLGRARVRAHELCTSLGMALEQDDGMAALRGAVAELRLADDSPFSAGERLIGACAVFAAAWSRKRASLPPVAPDPGASHAADFLRLVRGSPASAPELRALDAYWVTVIDHGMNASTLAARVVASTGSDLVSAVTAAICALKGPLHGGAPGPVLDMLDAIGAPEEARGWLAAELAAGRRIMGLGHRVYRVRDPRAAVLERAIEELGSALSDARGRTRLALARAVEREAVALLAERHPERALRANVEFYTAVLLELLGIPRGLFSATFAASRVAGWIAHVAEQRAGGRLIRPASRYIGARPAVSGLV